MVGTIARFPDAYKARPQPHAPRVRSEPYRESAMDPLSIALVEYLMTLSAAIYAVQNDVVEMRSVP